MSSASEEIFITSDKPNLTSCLTGPCKEGNFLALLLITRTKFRGASPQIGSFIRFGVLKFSVINFSLFLCLLRSLAQGSVWFSLVAVLWSNYEKIASIAVS